jgi:hypothetical protein
LGYVTCDNATNNGTMLVELARLLLAATGQVWDPIEHRIKYVILGSFLGVAEFL